MLDVEAHKEAVRRLVEEVINAGRLEAADELCTPEAAPRFKRWVEPFRVSFPDVRMQVVEMVAEGDRVAGRFLCSGTHSGDWRGRPPTGRRFENVDEVYFLSLRDGRVAEFGGIEDNLSRLRQLGIPPEWQTPH